MYSGVYRWASCIFCGGLRSTPHYKGNSPVHIRFLLCAQCIGYVYKEVLKISSQYIDSHYFYSFHLFVA